ncbi:unnamed protein product [Staurois parvus]|uniref:Uncharacterized protein n=1 Tax=Staurois parvus TaxID=386267 RepID=A0ABN9APL0_9NEOB|nr:unnamed protein product [Staurois parvus]
MGPPGNRGSWGPCVLAQTQKDLEKEWGALLKCMNSPKAPFIIMDSLEAPHLKIGCLKTRGGLTTHGAPGQ